MKNRLLFVLLSFVVLFSCKQQSKNVDASPSDQDIKDAYVYMLSRYLVIQQEIADVAKVDYNQVKYNPMGSAEFVNPNMDVLNTEACHPYGQFAKDGVFGLNESTETKGV